MQVEIDVNSYPAVHSNMRIVVFDNMMVFAAGLQGYIKPRLDKCKDKFTYGRPDAQLIRAFCADRFGWDQVRML